LQISAIFIGETHHFSAGGIIGYLLGDQLAELISRTVFNSTIVSPSGFSPLPSSRLWLLLLRQCGPIAPCALVSR
jgi:putative ABC transport system permease protein